MKSAGIVRVSGVRNTRDVVRYNEQEQKISGNWNGQEHSYTPAELCTYQGASQNGGGQLVRKGTAFIRNGTNNRSLYHLKHPTGHDHDTSARTIIQSFDYQLNPDLTPQTVHAMGVMFSDELRRYFQRLGRPLNDSLISTHLDRQQPKTATYDSSRILQPHLHSHIIVHSFNSQGEALAPLLRKNNLYDLQNLNDRVTDHFDLRDYRFAKLQHLVYPISAKTTYWNQLDKGSMSNLEKASQRYLNANRVAGQRRPDDFVNARKYRDGLLRTNFGYRTKQVNDLQHATSRQLFTMDDFKDSKERPIWYSTDNMQALQWRNAPEARAERFITRLDFNGVVDSSPTHREYQRTLRYAVQADGRARRVTKGAPRMKKQDEGTTKGTDKATDLDSDVRIRPAGKNGHPHYLISLRNIFQRVRREEEKIKQRTSEYVQRVKVQIEHIKARMERRREKRRDQVREGSLRMQREAPDYRTNEVSQYLTAYGANQQEDTRPRHTRSMHPQTKEARSQSPRPSARPHVRPSPRPKRRVHRPHPHF